MSNYDWDKNCAVVDRMFYWEYFIRGTTFTALLLSAKDLWFIKQNWYVDRAKRRLPFVIQFFIQILKNNLLEKFPFSKSYKYFASFLYILHANKTRN